MGSRIDRYRPKPAGEVNLVPFMNLIAILIPTLLISSEFIKIAAIAVSAPSNVSEPAPVDTTETPKTPLNLMILIGERGTFVNAQGVLLTPEGDQIGEGEASGNPTVPMVSVEVCTAKVDGKDVEVLRVWEHKSLHYVRGVRLVPDEELDNQRRSLQESIGRIDCRSVLDHNYPRLNELLGIVKERYAKGENVPDPRKVIINGETTTTYETVVRTMDTSRERIIGKPEDMECGVKEGQPKDPCELFPEVVLSAGLG